MKLSAKICVIVALMSMIDTLSAKEETMDEDRGKLDNKNEWNKRPHYVMIIAIIAGTFAAAFALVLICCLFWPFFARFCKCWNTK